MHQQLADDRDRSGDQPSPERRARRVAPVVAALAVMALALPGSVPRETAAVRAETPTVPPLYRMLYAPTEANERIDTAKNTLIADCMAAHGLTYTPHVEHVTEQEALAALRPFGLESADAITPEPPPSEANHSAEYARALFGDPDKRMVARGQRLEVSWPATGCQADAERRLLGDKRQRASELRLRLYDGERDTREQLDRDPVFAGANARWRACVNRARVDAPNPTALLSALPEDTDIAHDAAVRADLLCKRETGYLVVAYARLAGIQQDWLDAHAGMVDEWLLLRRHQDVVARHVLGPAR